MEQKNIENDISKYIDEGHFGNLHEQAFNDVLKLLMDFVQDGSQLLKSKDKLAWVCDSVMGSGKTTAIKVLLKYLATASTKIPLLLVFAEKNLMLEVYDEINTFATDREVRHLIEYVDSSNVNEVSQTLKQFQFVCITQQRFRDLTLNFGNWDEYRVFSLGRKPVERHIERLIVVDEMPILVDEAVFDVASKDNSVDWFDKLAEGSDFTAEEVQMARATIMMLITTEILGSADEERTFTKPLKAGFQQTKSYNRLVSIINRINTDKGDFESVRKLRWFKKLLHRNRIGAIDRHKKGTNILCA